MGRSSSSEPPLTRWGYLRHFARLAAPGLALMGIAVLASDLLSLVIPWLQHSVLNAVIAGQLGRAWRQLEGWALVAVASKVVGVGNDLLAERVRLHLANHARGEVYRHLSQRVPLELAEARGASQAVADVGYAGASIEILVYGIRWVVGLGTRVVGGLVAMSLLSPVVLVSVAPFCIGYMVVPRILAQWIRRREARAQEAAVAARTPLLEFIAAAQEIRLFGAADWCLQRLRSVWERRIRSQWESHLALTTSDGLNWCLRTTAMLTAWSVGVSEVSAHRLSVGGLIAVSLYLTMLFEPLERVMSFQYHWVGWMLDVDRTIGVLNLPQVPSSEDPVRMDVDGPVEVQDLRVQYQAASKPALRADRLSMPAGAATAIVGANGSGKSTLLKALLRFLVPQSGSVSFGGVPQERLDPGAFTRHVTGMVASPNLISGTIRDNLHLARPDADDAAIVASIDAAGLGAWLATLPDGLNTRLGPDGQGLSSGQLQRLALARAILHGGRVWILDEPTSAIDRASVDEIWGTIRRFGHTVVVATHDPALVDRADHIIRVEDGVAR